MLDENAIKDLSKRGKSVVEKKEAELLKSGLAGMYAAVEPDSEDILTGSSSLEALNKAEKAHPGKLFYITRIGKKVSVLLRRI